MPGSITPVKILPPDSGKIFIKSIGNQFKDGDIIFWNLEVLFKAISKNGQTFSIESIGWLGFSNKAFKCRGKKNFL